MPQDRVRRLTPTQRHVLRHLWDGWACTTGGRCPPRFHPFVFYRFHHGEAYRLMAGRTLASLERQGLITWKATTLPLAYDGSTVPGYTLVLTPTGRTAALKTEG